MLSLITSRYMKLGLMIHTSMGVFVLEKQQSYKILGLIFWEQKGLWSTAVETLLNSCNELQLSRLCRGVQ